MKTVEYNKKSLHYRLATVYGNLYEYDNETNICTYIRRLAMGFLMCCVIVLFCSAAVTIMLSPLLWLLVVIQTQTIIEPTDVVKIVLAMYFICGCIGLLYLCWNLITNRSVTQAVSNSIVGHAYDSIHNKICFKVKFK